MTTVAEYFETRDLEKIEDGLFEKFEELGKDLCEVKGVAYDALFHDADGTQRWAHEHATEDTLDDDIDQIMEGVKENGFMPAIERAIDDVLSDYEDELDSMDLGKWEYYIPGNLFSRVCEWADADELLCDPEAICNTYSHGAMGDDDIGLWYNDDTDSYLGGRTFIFKDLPAAMELAFCIEHHMTREELERTDGFCPEDGARMPAPGFMYRLTTDAMEKMFLKNREAFDQEGEE